MRKFVGFEKGINLGGWLSQCSLEKEHLEAFITKSDIQAVKRMGLDHVRVPIDYLLVETENGDTVESGYTYIDRCVRWCGECGLHMILDLHRTAGYSFDEAKSCGAFFSEDSYKRRFLALWEKLAARYGGYDHLAFDILNEVVDPEVSDTWNELAAQAVAVIRRYAPDIPVLIGGTQYNSINALKDLLMPPDDKVVYTFHFYEPHVFTHQGAPWESSMKHGFHTKYPLTAAEYLRQTNKELDGNYSDIFLEMPAELSGADMLSSFFGDAMLIAEKRNVPLYCGEYGVIALADTEYALNWFRDVHTVFERFKIGRALWSYKKMFFGITDEHYKDIFDSVTGLL